MKKERKQETCLTKREEPECLLYPFFIIWKIFSSITFFHHKKRILTKIYSDEEKEKAVERRKHKWLNYTLVPKN